MQTESGSPVDHDYINDTQHLLGVKNRDVKGDGPVYN